MFDLPTNVSTGSENGRREATSRPGKAATAILHRTPFVPPVAVRADGELWNVLSICDVKMT